MYVLTNKNNNTTNNKYSIIIICINLSEWKSSRIIASCEVAVRTLATYFAYDSVSVEHQSVESMLLAYLLRLHNFFLPHQNHIIPALFITWRVRTRTLNVTEKKKRRRNNHIRHMFLLIKRTTYLLISRKWYTQFSHYYYYEYLSLTFPSTILIFCMQNFIKYSFFLW